MPFHCRPLETFNFVMAGSRTEKSGLAIDGQRASACPISCCEVAKNEAGGRRAAMAAFLPSMAQAIFMQRAQRV
jgi:hypothetical protein